MAEAENNVTQENMGQENGSNDFTPINSREELEEYLNEAREQMKAEFGKSLANERKRYEEKTKKLEREMELSKMTEEERVKQVEADAKKQQEDEVNALRSELETLKQEKRTSEIKSKLLEQKLPNRYLNDTRLVNSTDIDKTLKELKKEYDAEVGEILKNGVKDTSPRVPSTPTKTTDSSELERLLSYTRAGR